MLKKHKERQLLKVMVNMLIQRGNNFMTLLCNNQYRLTIFMIYVNIFRSTAEDRVVSNTEVIIFVTITLCTVIKF